MKPRMTDTVIDSRMDRLERWAEDLVDRRWKLVVLGFWVIVAIALVIQKANAIHWFALTDTDDNMRFDQVRDWLAGQGWYDLRQYRMNPPGGFSIHWSRLVDLPLAALILILKPIVGTQLAYRWACAIAPMLPMMPAMMMSALTVRRLVGPRAYVLGLPLLLCAGDAMGMWAPLRIDHHGWQLAFLMTTVAGLTEPNRRRSGIIIAISSALSLAIGLEMLPYIAFAGAAVALHWAWDAAETPRIRSYGASLAISTVLCFLIFASNDNWHPVCDVLSPVWMTTVASAALMLVAISFVPAPHPAARLALVAIAGAIAGAIYVLGFPQCFGHRLEGIPPEADKLWLSHVGEARPVYLDTLATFVPMVAMAFIGTMGALIAMARRWGTRAAAEWAPVALFALFATALLFWQVRTAPSAEMLAVPGATFIALWGFTTLRRSTSVFVRVIGPVAAFLIASGLIFTFGLQKLPDRYTGLRVANLWNIASGREKWPAAPKPGAKPKPDLSKFANRRCPTIPALAPIAKLPPATFFTLIDNGPRLITLTHHSAVSGPYHRNWRAILDTEHAFRGTPDQAHAIIVSHHAQYLLLCPHMSEGTIYQAEAPAGFYSKLQTGWTPTWLARQPLPANSPYQLWKIVS
jgi:hypothetical protein